MINYKINNMNDLNFTLFEFYIIGISLNFIKEQYDKNNINKII